jgi:ArsR family transcriptional regulator
MKSAKSDVSKCNFCMKDEKTVKKFQKTMPKEEEIIDIASFFSVFGDGTRMKILWILDKREICVCDIALVLNMTKSSVSHQLRILKQARLVSFKKDGKRIYYSLADSHVSDIIKKGFEHMEELYEK